MRESGYYPPGAEFDPRAPYNQVDPKPKQLEVVVSVTLSKTFTIDVDDYIIEYEGKDESGNYVQDIDYSGCNLAEAVKNQCFLPQEAAELLEKAANGKPIQKQQIEDLKDWIVDDFEVIEE